jgi:hypothetical protein
MKQEKSEYSSSGSGSNYDENSMSDLGSSSIESGNSLIFHDPPEDGNYDNQLFGANVHVMQGKDGGRGSHLMPIQFAKEHIIKIEEDMKKMHDRHVRLMREMDENYKLIEQET